MASTSHVRRGDTVAIIAGKERGKRGKVLRVLLGDGRVLVEKINMVKKHQRPTQRLRQGGIIEREGALHLSNVLLVCGRCDRPVRIGIKVLDFATADLQSISGQKPIVTRAKKSIANFKLREGVPIGAKVTLRGARMYEFLDRLINVALPRVRDFKGVPGKGFDGRGNYALGLQEQVIFPEIVYDKVDKIRGMDINIVTTARTDEDAKALLAHLGMPFRE